MGMHAGETRGGLWWRSWIKWRPSGLNEQRKTLKKFTDRMRLAGKQDKAVIETRRGWSRRQRCRRRGKMRKRKWRKRS